MATNEEVSPSVTEESTEEFKILSSDELQLLSSNELIKKLPIVKEEINDAISTKNDIRYNYLTEYKKEIISALYAKKNVNVSEENK